MTEVYKASGFHQHIENLPKLGTAKFILGEMKTEPAVALLRKTDWRDFFEHLKKKDPDSNIYDDYEKAEMYDSDVRYSHMHKSDAGRSRESRTPSRPLSASLDTLTNHRESFLNDLSAKFENMVKRVISLWDELKVPDADRKFYTASLCRSPPESARQCIELAKYINSLKNHRESTIGVLRAIKLRESSVASCCDILAAIKRKNLRSGKGLTEVWKTELICALEDVAVSSVFVVACIQNWRESLWRPLPFMFNGENYYNKMASDMKVIETESFSGIVSSLPISSLGILCVTFNPNMYVSEYDLMLPLENDSPDILRLKVTAMTVIRENEIQDALEVEKKALLESGTFIPLLRLLPSDSSNTQSISFEQSAAKLKTISSAISVSDTGTKIPGEAVNDDSRVGGGGNSPFDQLTSLISEGVDDSFWLASDKESAATMIIGGHTTTAFEELSSIFKNEEDSNQQPAAHLSQNCYGGAPGGSTGEGEQGGRYYAEDFEK